VGRPSIQGEDCQAPDGVRHGKAAKLLRRATAGIAGGSAVAAAAADIALAKAAADVLVAGLTGIAAAVAAWTAWTACVRTARAWTTGASVALLWQQRGARCERLGGVDPGPALQLCPLSAAASSRQSTHAGRLQSGGCCHGAGSQRHFP
jgi:hypothetical protein